MPLPATDNEGLRYAYGKRARCPKCNSLDHKRYGRPRQSENSPPPNDDPLQQYRRCVCGHQFIAVVD